MSVNNSFSYRLGVDLGVTSLGWATVSLDANNQIDNFLDMGVRIFPSGRDAQTFSPTSVTRRDKRGARRNRDRYLKRRSRLIKLMIELGLQPKEKNKRDLLAKMEPLQYRVKSLSEKIDLFHLGRALFHINQRRGFKSNRIADRQEGSDAKGLLGGINELEEKLAQNQQTLGEFLFDRLNNKKSTRLKAGDNQYDLWTSRKMYEDEFYAICKKQQSYYPKTLTDANIKKLHNEIFYQRPLKPQEAGYCSLVEGQKRARAADNLTQLFRIYQEVNNLSIIQEDINTPTLTNEHKNLIIKHLCEDYSKLNKNQMLTWDSIQKIIGIRGIKFNLQHQGRKGLKANITDYKLLKVLDEVWTKLNDLQKSDLVDIIVKSQTKDEFEKLLSDFENNNVIQLTESQREQLENTSLEDGYGRVSLAAINKILPELKKGKTYDKACEAVGINHSDDRTGEIFEKLKYYGEILPKAVIGGDPNITGSDELHFGKINNPTVHMALNQFKVVINALIDKYGKAPDQIHIEMAREVSMSKKQHNDHIKQQTKNKKDNDRINDKLLELNVNPNYANRMKYKLWEDLSKDPVKRCCPLTGITINQEKLFTPEFEIEHIIPFSKSFDDSRCNKMICHHTANKYKGNRTPFDAFSESPEDYKWEEILERAKLMPTKFKRFLPDAQKWLQNTKEGQIISRQLNDTKYMSRIARQYAESVCYSTLALKGKFTSDLRHHWGLDKLTHNFIDGKWTKDRSNHHHHAIDALVVAMTDVSTMIKIQKANKRARQFESNKLLIDIEKPFSNFSLLEIENRLKNIVISHKLDHKSPKAAIKKGATIGQLHKDTNYGHLTENIYVTRKMITDENFNKQKQIDAIANPAIKQKLQEIFNAHSNIKGTLTDKKGYKQQLELFRKTENIKRLRVHLAKTHVIPIKNRKTGKPYRYVIGGNNFCAEIYCSDKGKKSNQWQSEIIQNFDINQKDFVPLWKQKNPTAYKVMRLQINDMLAIDLKDKSGNTLRLICRIQKINSNGSIILRNHNDSQSEQKTQLSKTASSLQQSNARKIFVSPIGEIYDPGCAKRPKWHKDN